MSAYMATGMGESKAVGKVIGMVSSMGNVQSLLWVTSFLAGSGVSCLRGGGCVAIRKYEQKKRQKPVESYSGHLNATVSSHAAPSNPIPPPPTPLAC